MGYPPETGIEARQAGTMERRRMRSTEESEEEAMMSRPPARRWCVCGLCGLGRWGGLAARPFPPTGGVAVARGSRLCSPAARAPVASCHPPTGPPGTRKLARPIDPGRGLSPPRCMHTLSFHEMESERSLFVGFRRKAEQSGEEAGMNQRRNVATTFRLATQLPADHGFHDPTQRRRCVVS